MNLVDETEDSTGLIALIVLLTLFVEIIVVVGLTFWEGTCVLATPSDGIDEILVAVGAFKILVIFETDSGCLRVGDLFGDDVLGACVEELGIKSFELAEFGCNFWSLADNSLLFKPANLFF